MNMVRITCPRCAWTHASTTLDEQLLSMVELCAALRQALREHRQRVHLDEGDA